VNRYDEAAFLLPERGMPGKPGIPSGGEEAVDLHVDLFSLESGKKYTPARARRLSAKGDAEVFDAGGLRFPLAVTPLRTGDRIRPFGQEGEKKVKEILIDRKVSRDERWGRPVVRDAEGAILWIPGVLRSAHAPVTPMTRNAALLRIRRAK
jgi:tRNA(Ile)-lysidine synthetase-like protein